MTIAKIFYFFNIQGGLLLKNYIYGMSIVIYKIQIITNILQTK